MSNAISPNTFNWINTAAGPSSQRGPAAARFEIRSSKFETDSKFECRNFKQLDCRAGLWIVQFL